MAVSDATELRKFTFVFIITKKIDVILYLYLYCRDESKQWEGKTSSKRDNKIDLCVYNSQDCRTRKLTYMLMLQCLISNSSLLWKKEKCEGNKTWDDFSQSKYPLNGKKRMVQYSNYHVWRYSPIKMFKKTLQITKARVVTKSHGWKVVFDLNKKWCSDSLQASQVCSSSVAKGRLKSWQNKSFHKDILNMFEKFPGTFPVYFK